MTVVVSAEVQTRRTDDMDTNPRIKAGLAFYYNESRGRKFRAIESFKMVNETLNK